MPHLTRANKELFRRCPDERFASLDQLYEHCDAQHHASVDHWHPPGAIRVVPASPEQYGSSRLELQVPGKDPFMLNDWSFTQICSLAKVSKETLNKLSPDTACRVLGETLPGGSKPLQIYTLAELARSIHGASYTRLENVDLLNIVREFATDFQPPPAAKIQHKEKMSGGEESSAVGLYCGERDMFCFLIDYMGWIEIDGHGFAPGFFLWNSEVGCRSLGIQTFWFQALCANGSVENLAPYPAMRIRIDGIFCTLSLADYNPHRRKIPRFQRFSTEPVRIILSGTPWRSLSIPASTQPTCTTRLLKSGVRSNH